MSELWETLTLFAGGIAALLALQLSFGVNGTVFLAMLLLLTTLSAAEGQKARRPT